MCFTYYNWEKNSQKNSRPTKTILDWPENSRPTKKFSTAKKILDRQKLFWSILGRPKKFSVRENLEEARTIDYVTNYNVITIDHLNGGRTRGNIGVKYSLLFRFHFDCSMPNYRKR